MTLALIEGEVDDSRAELDALRDEVRDLRRELSNAKAETRRAQREAQAALSALRKQLSPLYHALQAVFGELDAVGEDEPSPSNSNNQRAAAIWASWKEKFPGKPAMMIDALLLHGAMTQTQIAIAIQSARQNVGPIIYKLNKAGLLSKNGNLFSLKQL